MPKTSQDRIQQRLVDRDLRHSQMAEQLMEVPTILYFLKQQLAEQTVDIPVPLCRGGSGGGGLQGFRPGQVPTASSSFLDGMRLFKGVFALFPDFKKVRSPP